MSIDLADNLINSIETIEEPRPNVLLFLCTPGGSADAAYIITKSLKKSYNSLILYIPGYCKSAGTLVALGADEIWMGSKGEFGPLDAQIQQEGIYEQHKSGLNAKKAMELLGEQAIHFFKTFSKSDLIDQNSSDAPSVIADLVVGLLQPIAEKIDPLQLAENQRALDIAKEYGLRLGGLEKVVNRLIYDYPSHDFWIDFDEANHLFKQVHLFTSTENGVVNSIQLILKEIFGIDNGLRWPSNEGFVINFNLR